VLQLDLGRQLVAFGVGVLETFLAFAGSLLLEAVGVLADRRAFVSSRDVSAKFPTIIEMFLAELALVLRPIDSFLEIVDALILQFLRELNLQGRALPQQLFADFLVDLIREGNHCGDLPHNFPVHEKGIHGKYSNYDLASQQ
jgi:hypothetical protein